MYADSCYVTYLILILGYSQRLRELEATVSRSEKVRYGIQNERLPSTKYLSPQTMENLVEHITCEICTLRMWSPYTCVHRPYTTILSH